MSLRDILWDWIEAGLEPTGTPDLPPSEQREFVADVYAEVPDHLYDAVIETLVRKPQTRSEFIANLRAGDFAQQGALVDRVCRQYIIGSEYIERELQETAEQNTDYSEEF